MRMVTSAPQALASFARQLSGNFATEKIWR
jgi:hypothetical protein